MNGNLDEKSSGGRRELLVIISEEGTEESFKQVNTNYKVQQVGSPRVLVIEGEPNDLAKLRAITGVTVITSGDAPPGIAKKLDEGEALFVAAWLSRIKEGPSKRRPGEGLSWDAPGFEPPDPPADDSEHNK